jgi:uncharacterized protein (TIRG00374 family)
MTLETPQSRKSGKKLLWVLLKIVIGFGLLVYLIWEIGARELLDQFEQVPLLSYLIGLTVYSGGMALRTIRWDLLLQAVGPRLGLGHLIKLQFIGVFFQQFLPTSLGGDGVRVFYLYRDGIAWEKALGSILVERATGMLMLILMGLIAGVTGYHIYQNSWILWVLALFLAGMVGGLFFLFSERVARLVLFILGRLKLNRLCRVFEQFSRGIRVYRSHPRTLFWVTAISIPFQFLVIWLFYFFSGKLGMSVSFGYFLLFVPILIIVSQAPTPNGLGVRECTSVLLFTRVGATKEQALLLSLSYALLHFGAGLIGGLFFMVFGGRKRTIVAEIQEEWEAEEACGMGNSPKC